MATVVIGKEELSIPNPFSSISQWSRLKPLLPIEIGLRRCRERFSVGAGRPSAEGPWRPNSFGTHADRRPEAFMPIEIGLPRRSRAGRRPSPTQETSSRSAQADRWPQAPGGRIHSACMPSAGRRLLRRLKSAFQGAARQASAFADAKGTSRSAQADRRPKAPPVEFIRHPRPHSFSAPCLRREPPEQRPHLFIRHRPFRQRQGLLIDGIQGQPPA